MNRYGININVLHLTISHVLTISHLTIFHICQNVKIIYRQELASLFQMKEKSKACRNSKSNFWSCCFIADDSHVKIVWVHAVVLTEHNILHF